MPQQTWTGSSNKPSTSISSRCIFRLGATITAVAMERWAISNTADGYLYGARYYATTEFSEYLIWTRRAVPFCCERTCWRRCRRKVSRRARREFHPMLVSETLTFVDTEGQTYFSSVNGRFYYMDMSFAEYCLEAKHPTDPMLKA